MTEHNRLFRVEAVLEAPLWVLALAALLVTVAVVASAVAL